MHISHHCIVILAFFICIGMLLFTCVPVASALPEPIPCNLSRGSCYAPEIHDRWQWQLSCSPDIPTCTKLISPGDQVQFYDIDWEENSKKTVRKIHNSGGRAIAYISAGTWENYRSDKDDFPKCVIGTQYEEWPDEYWLDVRRIDVLLPIMRERMKVCKKKGFDGVQFDNLDGFQQSTGFPLTRKDYVKYAARLSNIAHTMGLSCAWENSVELRKELLPYMDWFLMEECFAHGECSAARTFTDAGKFVGGVEYVEGVNSMKFCNTYAKFHISGMLKKINLGFYRTPCTNTECVS